MRCLFQNGFDHPIAQQNYATLGGHFMVTMAGGIVTRKIRKVDKVRLDIIEITN
ncbi:hypothetical protein N643_11605 [Salmonella bongori serovar 48:z41:-- str. RKS3044]|nr:hypothetical protein N643_11605 [Salmonella bongori serovar 48:z41:-- str. RKS3044]